MTVFVKRLAKFQRDEIGAVTTDWVVLTSSIVGISLAATVLIFGGIEGASGNIVSGIGTSSSSTFSTQSEEVVTRNAVDFYNIGIAAYPDHQKKAWRAAREEVSNNAPDGFEYTRGATRYVDNTSGNPMYVSDDGKSYSIGGETVLVSDYRQNGNRTSFRAAFDEYWDSQS